MNFKNDLHFVMEKLDFIFIYKKGEKTLCIQVLLYAKRHALICSTRFQKEQKIWFI